MMMMMMMMMMMKAHIRHFVTSHFLWSVGLVGPGRMVVRADSGHMTLGAEHSVPLLRSPDLTGFPALNRTVAIY